MKKQCIIEIGTNSIKCLIAIWDDSSWQILSDRIYPVRLGEGLGVNQHLNTTAIDRNLTMIDNLILELLEFQDCNIAIIATEGIRKGINADAMLAEIERKYNLKVRVLTGEEEAELSYIAVTHDISSDQYELAVLDIGGGSTELILGNEKKIHYSISMPIGAVVLTNKFIHTDPILPSELSLTLDCIKAEVRKIEIEAQPHKLICVGGTVTTLAMLLSNISITEGTNDIRALSGIDGSILTQEHIDLFKNTFIDQTNPERQCIPNMPKDRADIILAGTLILDTIMQFLRLNQVTVCIKGVRHGFLYSCISQEG
jgi:exopolyphosphatase/guanosine-5'-triphosphate,3'-diphosphate pyrophosphatase